MKEIVIDSLSDLNIVAKALLSSLNGRSVVALFAPMGAGKTAAQGIHEYLSAN